MILLEMTQVIPTSLVNEDGNSVALLTFAMIGLSVVVGLITWFKKRLDKDTATANSFHDEARSDVKELRKRVESLSEDINDPPQTEGCGDLANKRGAVPT